jgi:hypothetical protein
VTKEQFIQRYAKRSDVTWEYLSQFQVALPCECGNEMCEGWAMVDNNAESIRAHNELYGPAS